MGLLNICSYETTKDNVSNLIALINRYHPAGQIKPKIKGNIVRLDIISDSTLDFWYMLPSFSFTYKNDLTKKQLMVKKYIESLFFERLRLKHTDSNIIMIRYNVKISYKELLEIIQSLKFSVKLLGATILDVEGYGEEKYIKNKLISFNSKTKQNKKEKFVNLKLNKDANKFIIKGSSYSGETNTENVIGNWWNHKLLQAESQISPVSGSIKKQIVTFIGKEKIILYGKNYETDHFTLKSKDSNLPDDKKLNFDIWFDKTTGLILKVKYSRMGDWEYRLKSYK